MSIFSEFFGDDDNKEAYQQASADYQNWMNKAVGELKSGEAQGRDDIKGSLKTSLGYYEPYMKEGSAALNSYLASMGGKGQDKFSFQPGYGYESKQAANAVKSSAAARGLVGSGAEQSNLQGTSQALVNKQYGDYQGRLAALSGLGQQMATGASQDQYQAGGELANLGGRYDSQIASAYGNMGSEASQAQLAEALDRQKQQAGRWESIGEGVGDVATVMEQIF